MDCADFIGSQVGKGWRMVDTIYEGRGSFGSHMRRTGIKKSELRSVHLFLLVEEQGVELNQIFDDLARIEIILQGTSLGQNELNFEPKSSRYMAKNFY